MYIYILLHITFVSGCLPADQQGAACANSEELRCHGLCRASPWDGRRRHVQVVRVADHSAVVNSIFFFDHGQVTNCDGNVFDVSPELGLEQMVFSFVSGSIYIHILKNK